MHSSVPFLEVRIRPSCHLELINPVRHVVICVRISINHPHVFRYQRSCCQPLRSLFDLLYHKRLCVPLVEGLNHDPHPLDTLSLRSGCPMLQARSASSSSHTTRSGFPPSRT